MTAPGSGPKAILRRLWRDALSIYYANTPTWRWLKGGTLVLFGLFCWSAANVLRSYRPEWALLTYVMAYGVVLIVWGPLTHLVLLPMIITLRRRGVGGRWRPVLRHVTKINLTVFFAIVLVLGTLAPGAMVLDFSGALEGAGDGGDVEADLVCERVDSAVQCEIDDAGGVDHVVVFSGGDRLRTLEHPPFRFEVALSELESTVTGRDLTVELRDADGDTLRRYVRQF